MDILRKKSVPTKQADPEGGTGSYADDLFFFYSGVSDPDKRAISDRDTDEAKAGMVSGYRFVVNLQR